MIGGNGAWMFWGQDDERQYAMRQEPVTEEKYRIFYFWMNDFALDKLSLKNLLAKHHSIRNAMGVQLSYLP